MRVYSYVGFLQKERKRSFSGLIVGVFASTLVVSPTNLLAQQCAGTDLSQCHCQPSILSFPNNTVEGGASDKIPVLLEADNVEADGEDSVTLSGDAFVAQGRQSISGGTITYSRETDQVNAVGGVKLRSLAGDSVEADSIELDVNQKIGVATNAKFKLAERGEIAPETNAVAVQSRGTASKISLEGEQFVRMENVKYTTCADGQNDFFINAKSLEIDQATGMGKAKNASIVFKGVPLLYLPTLTFPINDQRKSGFLFPSIGSDTNSGFVFEAPWYWNIAPNVDATFFPRLFSDRGVQLGVEVRHKTDAGETQFYAEHLPSDDELLGEDRTLLTIKHDSDITQNLSLDIDFNDVSDRQYFEDFRSDIGFFSATYVPRSAKLSYSADYWDASLGYSDYEIVDDAINADGQPFERRPELSFSTDLPKAGVVQFDVSGAATNFSHDTREEGWRYVVKPKVSIPFEEAWGYVTPALEVNHASYDLDGIDVDSRTTPIFTVDSGLYLEKDTTLFGEQVTQTLEPRALYSYIDESDQNNAPIFDTEELKFNNFNSLYSSTGFTGDDRVADNQQLSLSVTTRMFDDNGKQRLKASLGQAYYTDDRQVTINGIAETRDKSDLLGEIALDLGNNWTVESFLQYDTEASDFRTTNVGIKYELASDKFVSFGYRNSDDASIDQLIVEGEWPVSQSLSVFGTERYGLDESESLQTRVGFEYDACCWRLRLAADRLRRSNSETRNAVFAEFELTGIGKVNSGF